MQRRWSAPPLRLRWVWRLVAAAAVGVVWAARLVAADAAPGWVEVLRQDDSGVELLLHAPAPLRDGAQVVLPGFAAGGAEGLPQIYENAAFVGVPGRNGARLEILQVDTETIPGLQPQRVPPRPSPRLAGAAALDAEPAMPRRTWTGSYPPSPVALGEQARLRGRDVVVLRFTPLQFHSGGGATCARTAHVRLTFNDRPRRAAAPIVEPMHAGLLNAASAAAWELASVGVQKQAPTLQDLPAQRLRIRIPSTGIYQISFDQLRAAAPGVEAEDPTTFQLFVDRWDPVPLFADSVPSSWQPGYALQEVALWVPGEENHLFELGERIVFYALGPKEYLDLVGTASDSLLHGQNPYDNANYAWLVWGQQPGLRMQSADVAVSGNPTFVDRAWQRFHLEEDHVFDTVDDLWFWDEIRANRPAITTFRLDLGGDAAPLADIRIGIGAADYHIEHIVNVVINSDTMPSITWDQPATLPDPAYFDYPHPLDPTQNRVELTRNPASPSPVTLFLKIDVSWERPLALPAAGGSVRWSRRPSGAQEAYELRGFGDSFTGLDVTDPLRPVRLTNPTKVGSGSNARWQLLYGRGAGVRTHFHAVQTPGLVPLSDLSYHSVAPLRSRTQAPDMLIVVHTKLRAEADRLAAHRAQHYPDDLGGRTPDILVVNVADVYDNFSGGRVDPLAIRNFAKFLYDLPPVAGETQTRLRYLMLFGEATHDPRRLQPGSTETLVPTVQPWYADPRTRRDYAVDDWLAEMEAPARFISVEFSYPVPDLGIGRITPRTTTEAARIVDKFIAYDNSTDYGAWRDRLLLTADDECTPTNGCGGGELNHINFTEDLVPLTPIEWDVAKVYLTEYPKTLGQKPQGRAAFIRAWSAGCALVNYQGHGAPRQLADEVLFLGSDVPSLVNGRRLPLFAALSCTVSEFDAPEAQSMTEDMILAAGGGAVATMGATTPTYSFQNARYNTEVWRALFPSGATSRIAFGIAHQVAKTRAPLADGRNNETYILLGDPAMTFLSPENLVGFDAGTDSLEAGRSAHVGGFVHAPGTATPRTDFDGRADVEVFGTDDDSGYTSAENPGIHLTYDLPGPPLYRGTVDVHAGRFGFDFVVPLGARLGNKARVSAYAYDAASGVDAKGGVGTVRVVHAAAPDSSTGAPQITLHFSNNVTRVKPGTVLLAEIRDENGINIQGTALPSSILLDFDAQNQPLNVTAQFRYADGSATVGSLQVPLPQGLLPGRHSATLIASDNLQNRASATLEFDVIAEASEQLVNVIAFPNPFKDRTYFFFEVTDPSDVLVRVYTTSGREVWRASRSVTEAQQVQIRWDGVDQANDELANGTYLYQVEARPRRSSVDASGNPIPVPKGPLLRSTGKVVIMRE
jgi:peptidase C25-like protein/flagellar hook capping protein FlgD